MYETLPVNETAVPDVTSQMLGQIYDVNDQCRLIHGSQSRLCSVSARRARCRDTVTVYGPSVEQWSQTNCTRPIITKPQQIFLMAM